MDLYFTVFVFFRIIAYEYLYLSLIHIYKGFVRGGANLDADEQAELRKLNEQISMLELTFGQNSLKETNAFQLVVDKKEDLSGLPETLIAAAATTAKEAGLDGKWVFTLHNPSVMPFLQYADNRALREKIYNCLLYTSYICNLSQVLSKSY